jgi:ornithine cyclodeaminase/alanine dehydrogenase-like protein (mu-crystallin family)
MRVIDSDAILSRLDLLTLVDALRRGHREGVEAAERILLSESSPGHTNNLLIWPAWKFGSATGAKLVSIFPENEKHGLGPNIHSVYVLFDGQNGQPLCLITGESFTRHKTAADSALGASFLARPDCEVLAVAGAGAQAAVHIRLLCTVRPSIQRVLVWNRTFAKAERLAGGVGLRGVKLFARENLEETVGEADIVTCLTSTTDPILQGAWLKPGTHVDLVGSFTPEMREADDETIRRGRLFVDSRRFTSEHCGDVTQPIANGTIAATDVVGDLFDLCSGRATGRLTDTEITIFKNGGGGHLDLMIARALYQLV